MNDWANYGLGSWEVSLFPRPIPDARRYPDDPEDDPEPDREITFRLPLGDMEIEVQASRISHFDDPPEIVIDHVWFVGDDGKADTELDISGNLTDAVLTRIDAAARKELDNGR
jgi:hypothetical protein